MAWKQVRAFNHNKMGTQAGWCLMNCRLGFGITKGTYASAKADMESQRKNGTLHDMASIPKNCSVPVYLDTASPYEHVMVYDKGVYWSDGKKLTSTAGLKFFGWGELCDGARVVEKAPEPQPTTPDLTWTKFDKAYIYETRLATTSCWNFNHVKDTQCEAIKKFNKGVKFEIVGRVYNKQINAYYLVTQDNYEHQIPVGFCEWDMTKVGEVKPSLDTDKLEQIYEEIIKEATDGVAIIKESK